MKNDKTAQENRQSARMRVLSLVKYTCLPGTSSRVANILNISRGGLSFLADDEIKPATALKLCFVVPHKKKSVEVQGLVVRCPKVVKDPVIFQIAVQFTEVPEEAKEVIHELEAIVSEQRKVARK